MTVSRLVPYKKVALIVEAFNQLGKNLVVIGGGPELEKLQKMAKPNVQILGRQPDEVVEDYLARAKAYVYAGCEDFGIVLVEAQACGTPVIAFNRGGRPKLSPMAKRGFCFLSNRPRRSPMESSVLRPRPKIFSRKLVL